MNPKHLTLHLTPYNLHPIPYTLHPTPYTLYSTPYTLHPTPYTLHPTPYTLETGILLPNNQRQHRTSHAPKDVLSLRICADDRLRVGWLAVRFYSSSHPPGCKAHNHPLTRREDDSSRNGPSVVCHRVNFIVRRLLCSVSAALASFFRMDSISTSYVMPERFSERQTSTGMTGKHR